jgi:hypothetical protein
MQLFSTSSNLNELLSDIDAPVSGSSIPSFSTTKASKTGGGESALSRIIKDDPLVSKQSKNVLAMKGYTEFTDIQRQALVPVFEGRDMIARSRTGTVRTKCLNYILCDQFIIIRFFLDFFFLCIYYLQLKGQDSCLWSSDC